MPKRERSGAEIMPERVVAPTRVNFGRFSRMERALRALVDDDVEPEVLHRRVEVLLDRGLRAGGFRR